jgi:hypothetical protein
MRRSRSLRFRSKVVTTTLAAVLMVGFMAPAANATIVIPKPFTMTLSPSVSTAGASAQFTATFTNWWLFNKLGSANLSVPTAYSITGVLTSRGTATVVGNTVQLRNLNLAFLHSFTVKVTATAACSASAGNVWSAAAKTAANFTGNAFLLITPANKRSSAVTGACSLAFVTQPADTGPGAVISSVTFDPDGPSVQVGVFDGANNLRTGGAPVLISMAIGTNPPGDGLLSGLPALTSAGIATFSDLSIDQPGDGYTLVASAGTLSATSDPFNIAGLVLVCEAGDDCSGSLSEGGTSGTVTALDTGSDALLTMSLTPAGTLGELDCDDYTEHSGTLTFNLTSSSEKEVTMTFDRGDYYIPLGDFQVCFQSGSEPAFLLPNCSTYYSSFYYDPPVPPCVEERTSYGSVVSLTFLAPSGDPKGRV